MARAAVALVALGLAMVGAVGCGEEEGVADGATVHAYVEAPVCSKAATVAVVGNEDGEGLRVKFICLPPVRGPELSQGVGGGRQIDLAIVGANARRATEDSTTVAYLQADDPAVNRFTEPILEEAGIGTITAPKGKAQSELLRLVGEADTSSLRADVREALEAG